MGKSGTHGGEDRDTVSKSWNHWENDLWYFQRRGWGGGVEDQGARMTVDNLVVMPFVVPDMWFRVLAVFFSHSGALPLISIFIKT